MHFFEKCSIFVMNLKVWALAFLAVFLISCNEFEKPPYPDVVLSKIQTSFPGSKRATSSSFVVDNKAYILFGRPELTETIGLNDCWEYSLLTEEWSQKSQFPGAGRVGAIAEVVQGKAYVGFGYRTGYGIYSSDSTILTDLWLYNPLMDSWEQKADFPKSAYIGKAPLNSCSSFAYKKWIYITGFYYGQKYSTEVWRYDTETDSWERINDFSGSARTGAVACTDGTHFYFGLGYNRSYRSDWWEYFPETDTWKERKSIPGKGRVNAVSFSVNNRFFVATGHFISGTLTGNEYFDDILEYDRARNVWYKIGKLPSGGRENVVAFVINDKAFIAFGESENEVYNDIWTFKP